VDVEHAWEGVLPEGLDLATPALQDHVSDLVGETCREAEDLDGHLSAGDALFLDPLVNHGLPAGRQELLDPIFAAELHPWFQGQVIHDPSRGGACV
jgi:hypothetical protein